MIMSLSITPFYNQMLTLRHALLFGKNQPLASNKSQLELYESQFYNSYFYSFNFNCL